jgi:hypothetical protein
MVLVLAGRPTAILQPGPIPPAPERPGDGAEAKPWSESAVRPCVAGRFGAECTRVRAAGARGGVQISRATLQNYRERKNSG